MTKLLIEGIHKGASVKNVWDLRMYSYRVFLFLMVFLVLGTVRSGHSSEWCCGSCN